MTNEPVGNGPRQGVIPGNSHKERAVEVASAEPREKVEKIITGNAVVRKQPWYKRAKSNMLADDAGTIGEYILIDVLVPALKNLVFDIITQGTGRALYPGGRAVGVRGGGGNIVGGGLRGNVSSVRTKYENMGVGTAQDPRQQLSRQDRATHNFKEITLPNREEAIGVVERLMELITNYGTATVTDFYDLVGVTGSYADQRWGWDDLRDANVIQHRGGWLIDLPPAKPLRG